MDNFFKERNDYQRYIIDFLVNKNKFIERDSKTKYNPIYAMDTELLLKFLEETQPEKIEQIRKIHGEEANNLIIKRVNNEITKRNSSLISRLKNGIYFDNNISLDLMYDKPATTFNEELNDLYHKNIFSVMEEVYHKENERIDLVIFLNGIAIITIELKSNQSGQNFENAIEQYKNDRDFNTRLLSFKTGALVHFAMDTKEVYMCTKLCGKSSYFLPFNKGNEEGGKGNPHVDGKLNVYYMWEDILTKDMLLYLIKNFIFVEKEEKEDPKTGVMKLKENVIFPRYHQLDAIRKLVNDIKANKTAKNYLIEHSAGSGKTKTIAWLAHRLQSLHDLDEKNIFDSILIITDRIVVDQQLQNAIIAIDHKQGLIKVMDEKCTSSDLADALKSNTKIIVSTIQKFRYILDETKNILDRSFAIIIDEAHSSTSGKNMAAVTEVLSDEENEEDSVEDLILDEITKQGKQKNISMIAFTATPKKQTLQLFGNINKDGKPAPFHIYGMKQAIQEEFILDVLTNYTTYKTYYEVSKKMEENPDVFSSVVKKKINRFVDMHPTNIGQKVEIIIEHFRNCIMRELGGKAKAMVITSSRESAVRYRNEFEKYVKLHNYGDIKALVAFSGKVTVDGKEYSEVGMNNISENALREEFDKDDYQVLLVANKYQTGFDQPKLVAMYVDKKLSGIAAVQTLSRLNRICPPYNKQTFILDFKNSYEDIKRAFEPYYDGTILSESINPEMVYDLIAKVDAYNFMDFSDVLSFNDYAYKNKKRITDKVKMESLIDRALSKIKCRDIKEQLEIKKNIGSFNKFYRFLIQATAFEDIDLHKKYNYLSVLYKELDVTGIKVDFNVVQGVDITGLEQKKKGEYIIKKGTQTVDAKPEIKYTNPRPVTIEMEQMKKLTEIIEEINIEKGINIDSNLAHTSLKQIKDILINNKDLKNSAIVNDYKDFNFAYYRSVDEALEEGYDHNRELYKLLLDDNDAKKRILGIYMEEIYKVLNKVNEDIPMVAEESERYYLDNDIFEKNVGRFKTISGRNIYYYGEEFGDTIQVKNSVYEEIKTLNGLFGILLKCWDKETAYPASQADYIKDNDPTYGQCAITAIIVNDMFGGTIHKIKIEDGGTHYFNKIEGHYIDLTRDQFDLYNIDIDYEPNEEVTKEYCLNDDDTLKRYNLLNQKIKKFG